MLENNDCLPHLEHGRPRTTRLTAVVLIMVLLMTFGLVLLTLTPTLPLWFVITLISVVGQYTIRICLNLLLTKPAPRPATRRRSPDRH